MKKPWALKQAGFTIVELLIVIVVIAILASVTIIAFNGVQERARNTQTTEAVAKYARALQSYAAINDGYPVPGLGVFVCLGEPAGGVCGNMTDSVVGACGGDSLRATTNATFNTAIKTVITSLPKPSDQVISCAGRSYTGAHYLTNTSKEGYITYYLRGNQTCGGIGGLQNFSKYQTGDITVCGANLPSLP